MRAEEEAVFAGSRAAGVSMAGKATSVVGKAMSVAESAGGPGYFAIVSPAGYDINKWDDTPRGKQMIVRCAGPESPRQEAAQQCLGTL
jgi:hypothetical protein